jgi:hypothetical protein
MPRHDADRNLLFGIFAVQLDYVTREALLAAMNAWVMEKHRPLADLLVERGALNPDDREHLESVIARHVARHGGDPERSLAAVGAASSVVSDLKRAVADTDVQASLGLAGSAPGDDPDSHATRAPEPDGPRSLEDPVSQGPRPRQGGPGCRLRRP